MLANESLEVFQYFFNKYWQSITCPKSEKKGQLFTLPVPILGNFWCLVVTSVTFSSNLSNFENNQKKSQKI